jgi:hypothetical protein
MEGHLTPPVSRSFSYFKDSVRCGAVLHNLPSCSALVCVPLSAGDCDLKEGIVQ